MRRRTFLKGVFAAAGATLVPIPNDVARALPMIIGDGIHDDAPAISAAMAGRDFAVHPDAAGFMSSEYGFIRIRGMTLRLSEPIRVSGGTFVEISHCQFLTDFDTQKEAILNVLAHDPKEAGNANS